MSEPAPTIESAVPAVLSALSLHVEELCERGSSAFAQGDLQQAAMILDQAREIKSLQDQLKKLSTALTKYTVKTPDRSTKTAVKEKVIEPVEAKPRFDPAILARQNRVKRLKRVQDDWALRLKKLLDLKEWGEEDIATAKALCCTGRALDEELSAIDARGSSLDHEIQELKIAFDSANEGIPFFGFNMSRSHSVEVWESLAENYELMSTSALVLDWLEQTSLIDEERVRVLATAAAAVETWLYRQFAENELRVSDSQQQEVNTRVRAFSEDNFYVPWWNMSAEAKVSTEDVADHARQLPSLYKMQKEAHERAKAKNTAEEILDRVLETDSAVEDFSHCLVQAVEEVFDAGFPPSDKKLRLRLAPFRQYLDESENGQIKKLNEYLRKDATAQLAKKSGTKDDEEAIEPARDPEFDALLAKVKQRLKGKTILFVGGNKGQAWRVPNYIADLGLRDLVWPDAEDKTKPSDLAGEVKKCDVAVLLIRFARHSFKQVLDEAKESGKETVTLSRGLNLRTFVQAYSEQVLN